MEKLLHIISGCANQDRQSQQMLYDQYYGLCLKIAFRYVNTYEQAVEVVHDAFLKMFRNFSRFEVRDVDKLEMLLIGWIRRVVINASIDYMRREMNNHHSYPIPEHVWEHKDEGQSSDNSLLYKELMILVKELPPAYRMVFNLHVIEGYSHPEIAKMLGITTGTSKSNLSKARAHLQKALTTENTETILCQT
ncbi:MAG: RNA polymerase subunit sigma-24 [Sphingobacteriales bacterium 50-39]|nr:sigma-70 family RNA polymerase sigma factor [Sphingobacteriales bacterium]OJW61058.1 MAG: RNA polymerase subunit sigma-24 [Sphingobacteriales bacterium 50-39]